MKPPWTTKPTISCSLLKHLSLLYSKTLQDMYRKYKITKSSVSLWNTKRYIMQGSKLIPWILLGITIALGLLFPLLGTPSIRISSISVVFSQVFFTIFVLTTRRLLFYLLNYRFHLVWDSRWYLKLEILLQVLEISYPLSFAFESISTLFWFGENTITLNRPLIGTLAIVSWAIRLTIYCWMRLEIFKYYRWR